MLNKFAVTAVAAPIIEINTTTNRIVWSEKPRSESK